MDAQEEAKYNFDFVIKLNRNVMQLVGIWPSVEDRFSKLRYFFTLTVIFMLVVPSAIQCSLVEDFFNEIEIFAVLLNMKCTVGKGIFLLIAKQNLKSLVEDMINDWNTQMSKEDKEIMIAYSKKAQRFSMFFLVIVSACGALISLRPLIWAKFTFSSQHTDENLRFLPFATFYPFDTQKSPNYELLYVLHIISVICLFAVVVTVNTFVALMVFHLCGQLQILSLRVKNIGKSKNQQDPKYLQSIVERHIKLASNSKLIENSFSNVILMDVITTVLSLCIQGYSVAVVSPATNISDTMNNVLFLSAPLFMVFLHCYIGENMIHRSTDIGHQVYDLNWYDYEPSFVRSLMLIIIRSQKQMELTAGKFFPMSFHAFKQIILSASSYTTVLLATSRNHH